MSEYIEPRYIKRPFGLRIREADSKFKPEGDGLFRVNTATKVLTYDQYLPRDALIVRVERFTRMGATFENMIYVWHHHISNCYYMTLGYVIPGTIVGIPVQQVKDISSQYWRHYLMTERFYIEQECLLLDWTEDLSFKDKDIAYMKLLLCHPQRSIRRFASILIKEHEAMQC